MQTDEIGWMMVTSLILKVGFLKSRECWQLGEGGLVRWGVGVAGGQGSSGLLCRREVSSWGFGEGAGKRWDGLVADWAFTGWALHIGNTWLDDRIHWQKSHGSFPWTKIMGLKNHVGLIHDFKFLISFQSYGHLARPWKSSRCRDDYWLRKQLCMILSNQQWLLGRGSLPSSMLLSWVESVVAKTWLQAPWAQSVVRLRC